MDTVIKRDGRTQNFNPDKIQMAVFKAARAEGYDGGDAHQISGDLWASLELPGDVIHIERIQDLVEETLMELDPKVAKAYIVYRHERSKLRESKPDSSAISDYICVSKYARYQPELGRRELYSEIVDRVDKMHQGFHHSRSDWFYHEYFLTFGMMHKKKVLASMRSMQFAGEAILVNNARLYNCSFTLIDRVRAFQEVLFLLLSGCGVGYSVQHQHVCQLPRVVKSDEGMVTYFTVDDTIEGWADALGALVSSYFGQYESDQDYVGPVNPYVEFIFQDIRPRGAPLRVSGGKAPGHVPLKKMLEKVRIIFDQAHGRQLSALEAHDVLCITAEAVLAGGIRRSSLISLFSPSDTNMITCKTGEWWEDHPHRAMANNSVVFLRDNVKREEFFSILNHSREHGEPGFFLTNNLNHGCNPCGEIVLDPTLKYAKTPAIEGHSSASPRPSTGFAFCNLTEINAAAIDTEGEFYEACRAAAFIGTLQASFTSFPYLGKVTEAIAQRDGLLGVSITGQMDNQGLLTDKVLQEGSRLVREINHQVAVEIGIRSAARLTTVKPSGTASILVGCVGSGIHPHHAKRYFRRVTANPDEPCFQYFRSINPHMCEEKPNGDWVITFPVETQGLTWDDLSAVEFMEKVFSVYENWVKPGTTNARNPKALTHNVSCTVEVGENEWDKVFSLAWENHHRIAAMSFLPKKHDYKFAPRERVADIAYWNLLVGQYRPVNWELFKEDHDRTDLGAVGACEGQECELPATLPAPGASHGTGHPEGS